MSSRTSVELGSLRNHSNCIRALLIRDMMARFGRANLGFAWTIMEPMLLTGGVLVLWSLLRQPVIHGIPLVGFVITLYMPLTMWRHMTTSMVRVAGANSELLYHRPISHIDFVAGRLLLEFLA